VDEPRTKRQPIGEPMVPVRSIADALWSFWSRGQRTERSAYVVGALLIVSGLVHLTLLVVTGAPWQGPLSLRKASTFGLSFGVTLITITWVASFLDLSARGRAIVLGAFTVASVMETALVSLQVWRGVPSHFNLETTFDAWIARALAGGGMVLVALIVVLTVAAFRLNPSLPISLLVAIRVGFATLVGAVVVGALMIAKGMLLVFRGDPEAAYATGGVLKPIHAVALHAILVLPALAWLLSFTNWNEERKLRLIAVAAAGYIAFAAVIGVANVTGLSLTSPPIATIALLTALSVLATGWLAIASAARATTSKGIQGVR
jgi:hypothetical protein